MSIEAPAPERRRAGRPKGAGRIGFRFAIVASPDYKAWMDGFRASLGLGGVSAVFREAVRLLAENRRYGPPPAF